MSAAENLSTSQEPDRSKVFSSFLEALSQVEDKAVLALANRDAVKDSLEGDDMDDYYASPALGQQREVPTTGETVNWRRSPVQVPGAA